MERSQKARILKDLEKKIVFIVGPRQVGKTWLAKDIGTGFKNTVYLNYDRIEDRKVIKNEGWLKSTELLILDELHKMSGWKRFIKGVFDTRPAHLKILVTGSARLDAFRQTGDSLAGRFYAHRLLPFSPAELSGTPYGSDIDRFMARGDFPNPSSPKTRRRRIGGGSSTSMGSSGPISSTSGISTTCARSSSWWSCCGGRWAPPSRTPRSPEMSRSHRIP